MSDDLLSVSYGTIYPALLKLEQEGYLRSQWSFSQSKAKFYRLTRAGRRQVKRAAREWDQATAIMAKFLRLGEQPS